MPAKRRRLRIVADGAHLVAEHGLLHDHPDDDRRNQRNDEAVVQPLALDDARQLRLGDDLWRLRPAEAHRVLQRPFEQHRDEEQHDEVEEQRGDDLVDAEAGLQHGRAKQKKRTRGHGGDHDDRNEQEGGQRQSAGAEHDGHHAADIELRLGADVPELCAEGDGDGEAGEDQRRCAGQRFEQRELRAGRASRDEIEDRKGRGAGGKHQQRSDGEGERRSRPAGYSSVTASDGAGLGSSRMVSLRCILHRRRSSRRMGPGHRASAVKLMPAISSPSSRRRSPPRASRDGLST